MPKRLAFLLAFIATAAFGQGTQCDRIRSSGASTFHALANTQTVVVSGATRSVATGNVFKTNNATRTTVTNFVGGTDLLHIAVICGDTNTTLQNNATIVACKRIESDLYYPRHRLRVHLRRRAIQCSQVVV